MSEQTFSCIILSMCMCLMKVEPNIRKEANYGFLVYIILKKFRNICENDKFRNISRI